MPIQSTQCSTSRKKSPCGGGGAVVVALLHLNTLWAVIIVVLSYTDPPRPQYETAQFRLNGLPLYGRCAFHPCNCPTCEWALVRELLNICTHAVPNSVIYTLYLYGTAEGLYFFILDAISEACTNNSIER